MIVAWVHYLEWMTYTVCTICKVNDSTAALTCHLRDVDRCGRLGT